MAYSLTNLHSFQQVDWDSVANDMGLKNANVAKVRYSQIRKKITDHRAGKPTASGTGKMASPSKVTKSGSKGPGHPHKDSTTTPTKNKAKKAGTKVVKKGEVDEDAEDQDREAETDNDYEIIQKVCAQQQTPVSDDGIKLTDASNFSRLSAVPSTEFTLVVRVSAVVSSFGFHCVSPISESLLGARSLSWPTTRFSFLLEARPSGTQTCLCTRSPH